MRNSEIALMNDSLQGMDYYGRIFANEQKWEPYRAWQPANLRICGLCEGGNSALLQPLRKADK
jgi:hypothetical protein